MTAAASRSSQEVFFTQRTERSICDLNRGTALGRTYDALSVVGTEKVYSLGDGAN